MLDGANCIVPPDDKAYHAWRADNPHGYVLNVRAKPSASYLVLHRADCPHISSHTNSGAFTERGYRKVCARSIAALARWLQREGLSDGSFSHRCRTCSPA